MSRPNVTDDVVDGLQFARACVLDQRSGSHRRSDHTWDDRYRDALEALDLIIAAHKKSGRRTASKA